jgi:ribose-phosphate pyrophosphokinase
MKFLFGQQLHDFQQQLMNHLPTHQFFQPLSLFPNGELSCQLLAVSPDETIVAVPSYSLHLHDFLMEAQLLCYAAKQAQAARIILLFPYLPYARQDQGMKLAQFIIQQCLSAGADFLVALDVHNPGLLSQVPQFNEIPILPLFAQDIQTRFAEQNIILVAPDKGSYPKVKALADTLNLKSYQLTKHRVAGEVHFAPFTLHLQGQTCLLIDDMIDTAQTLIKAVQLLDQQGAKTIHAYATHGLFTYPASQHLQNAPLSSLTITNTIPCFHQSLPGLRMLDASKLALPFF